jgi:capsule polysaccharide export protein KpsE/RkpR
MKRKTLWTVVGLVAIVLVVTVARADFRREHGWCGNGWHRGGPLGVVARELQLSDAQVSQVRSIWTEERPTVTALLKDLTSGMHQLVDTTAGGTFDEGKLQSIAAAEGNTFAKLLLEKERFKARVYGTVLNEQQRQSADRLQQRWLERIDRTVAQLDKQRQ